MCLGVPLQVRSLLSQGAALCGATDASARAVDTALLDSQPEVGDWLLVHVSIAIRALDAGEAQQIGDALLAVSAAAAGQPFEHLLGDLIDREPQLPAHLRESQQMVPDND